MANPLSDKALAVFAFAAYHQLSSGEAVSQVVIEDAAGHRADPEGVAELTQAGLLTVSGDRGALTETGQAMLDKVLTAVRSSAA